MKILGVFIVLISCTVVQGAVTNSCSSTSVKAQTSISCTCENTAGNGVTWAKDSVQIASCPSPGVCLPAAGYTVSSTGNQFTLEVSPYTYTHCGTYTCRDTADSLINASVTTSVYDFNSLVPSEITEPSSKKSGKIEITTDCLFKESDIIVHWYTVSGNDQPKAYQPDTKFSTPTSCNDTTKTCNGESAVTLNIGFEHTEKSTGCVKFKLEVYHSANTSDKIELTTTDEYCIKATSTMSTATTTSASTTTSTAPTSTSTTRTSTFPATISVSKSTTHTTASAAAISTTPSISSTTKAKSETITASADSLESKTVVIIAASVVGGLFVVGIVITISLMLLSQRKRRKHVSGGIHTYEENRNNKQFQRSKFPSSQGYSNDGHTFNGKSSGHKFKQNPLSVRQSNRLFTYQYQPRNGNYRQNPYSFRHIYPGFTDVDQYSGRYAGQNRRRNEALYYYSSCNLRPHYYSHPPNPRRSTSRMPVRETLHTDDQNCVVSDYSMYW